MSEEPSNLTKAQLLFWAGQKLNPEAALYNMAVSIAIEGDLDPVRFERALRAVVGSSDALQSTFHEESGLVTRRSGLAPNWPFHHIDLSGEEDPPTAARRWAEERCAHCFNLSERAFESAMLKTGARRHVWYLNQHHMVTDATSTSILFRRVGEHYAEDGGEPPNLPAFNDYVTVERAARNAPEADFADHYWRTKCANAPELPALYGTESSASESTQSERVCISLGTERSTKLRQLAEEVAFRCLTPHLGQFNLLATVLFAYLYRISGQSSLVIGAPAHHRPTLQFRETIGEFMELFPLFASIEPTDTFRSLYDQIREETTGFLRHAKPGAANPEFNRHYNVVLNYINVEFGKFAGLPTRTDWHHTGHVDRGHVLRLQVYDFDGSGAFQVNFDLGLDAFDESLRRAIPGHFLRYFDQVTDRRDVPLCEIDYQGQADLILLGELASGGADESLPTTLVAEFLRHAFTNPNQAAICCPEGSQTYGELEIASRQVAQALEEAVIPRRSIIPLLAAPGLPWFAAALGILRHGSAYVPVEPDVPPMRLEQMLRDAGSPLLLTTDSEYAQRLADLTVLELGSILAEGTPTLPQKYDRAESEGIAYVLYTSGSTGTPKGVCVPHAAVMNLVRASEQLAPLPPRMDTALWAHLGFDVSVYEVFTALTCGHTLHVPPPQARFDGKQLFAWWKANEVVSGYIPPFLLPELDDWLNENGFSAKRILVGVEPIPHSLLTSICRKCPGLKIINGYGPTEATVCAALSLIDPENDEQGPAPVGRPLPNTSCWIMDPHGRPSPQGAVGELWITGQGLATGYLNAPGLTRGKFGELAVAGNAPQRAYRTGDAMRFRTDGQLEFVGRLDGQLKIRGVRIEPAEIQAAMMAHNGVRQCVIQAVDNQLVAYFVAAEPVDITNLLNHLRCRLPGAMIPDHLVPLDVLPLTTSGKTDFAALPQPERGEASIALPATPTEEIIAQIIAEALGHETVSVDQTILQLGGDSLLAMRVLARICREFEIDLPLHVALRHPSVRELAKAVSVAITAEIEALDEEEAEAMLQESDPV